MSSNPEVTTQKEQGFSKIIFLAKILGKTNIFAKILAKQYFRENLP
jgi:hypothetical protein